MSYTNTLSEQLANVFILWFLIHFNRRVPGQPDYNIEDGDIPCTPNVESNYTYVFNVCGAVTGNIEKECKYYLKDRLRTAAALQINKRGTLDEDDDWCYVVGYYNQDQTSVRLLNDRDPTKGLQVTYKGDYCNGGKQRQYNLQLTCSDRLQAVPTHAYEMVGCEYTVTMPSVYGCPLECPVANRALCGGQGHCAYDTDKQAARCYCNRGYFGVDCTNTQPADAQTYSPALLGLIITLFVIIALLVLGVFMMIKQVAAYRDDVANYQVLKGGDEDGTASGGGRAGARRANPLHSSGDDSISSTLSGMFSPVLEMTTDLASKANAFLGSRVAARNASVNSMARQDGFAVNDADVRGSHSVTL